MASLDTKAEKQRVFLAYRTLFAGMAIQPEASEPIMRIVKDTRLLHAKLIEGLGYEKIRSIIWGFVRAEIFQSELKARIEFPELFDEFASLNVGQTAPKPKPPCSNVASPLKGAVVCDAGQKNKECANENGHLSGTAQPKVAKAGVGQALYFPYKTQHLILALIQHQLEDCCFKFAAKVLPEVLKEKGWTCPELGELNEWTKVLNSRISQLPASKTDKSTIVTIKQLLAEADTIRHTVVHRVLLNAGLVHAMVCSAARFAEAFGDDSIAAKLESLASDVQNQIKDMEQDKKQSAKELNNQIQAIAKKRAILDKHEQEAVASNKAQEQEHQRLAGSVLEASVRLAFKVGALAPADWAEEDDGASQAQSNKATETEKSPRKIPVAAIQIEAPSNATATQTTHSVEIGPKKDNVSFWDLLSKIGI